MWAEIRSLQKGGAWPMRRVIRPYMSSNPPAVLVTPTTRMLLLSCWNASRAYKTTARHFTASTISRLWFARSPSDRLFRQTIKPPTLNTPAVWQSLPTRFGGGERERAADTLVTTTASGLTPVDRITPKPRDRGRDRVLTSLHPVGSCSETGQSLEYTLEYI